MTDLAVLNICTKEVETGVNGGSTNWLVVTDPPVSSWPPNHFYHPSGVSIMVRTAAITIRAENITPSFFRVNNLMFLNNLMLSITSHPTIIKKEPSSMIKPRPTTPRLTFLAILFYHGSTGWHQQSQPLCGRFRPPDCLHEPGHLSPGGLVRTGAPGAGRIPGNRSIHWNGPGIDTTELDQLNFASLPAAPATNPVRGVSGGRSGLRRKPQ